MFALLNASRFDEQIPFGDMSACRANARREGFPRANLRARGVLSYNDTGADAVQHGKGFLLCSFSFVRKKRACIREVRGKKSRKNPSRKHEGGRFSYSQKFFLESSSYILR